MAAENRDIKYINKDFSELRNSLVEYAKTYFPTVYNDFTPSSPGMMFMEMSAYVGDVLSFYLDNQIQDDGTNVGVGGSPSSQKLRIYGGTIISNNNFYYGFNSVGSQATIVGISSGDNITLGQNNVNHSNTIIYGGTGNIEFSTGGSERMRLTSGGSLGIGTSTPAEKLDVYDNSASNVSIKVGNTSGALQLLQGNGAAYLYTATNQPLIFSNNNSEKMRLDASGNLIVGGTTAYAKFTIAGNTTASAADNRIVIVENPPSGNLGSQIAWTNSSTTYPYASVGFNNGSGGTSGNLIFSTNGNIFTNTNTERMRLDASGNLGLGVTPSAWARKAIQIGDAAQGYVVRTLSGSFQLLPLG